MSRSTLVKYKGETIVDLGRTVKPEFFYARGEKVPLPYETLSRMVVEQEDDAKSYIVKTIVALAAHHPTKEELEEIVMDMDAFVEDTAATFKEIGVARLLIDLSNEKDIDVELK